MITAPYNFVPLNKNIFIPSWYDQISQDIPFSDSEDGFIKINFTNTTPILISDNKRPISFTTPDGKRRFLIPASSLKGMIRNVMEIMTFSKFDKDSYNETHFGYRDFGGKRTTDNNRYIKILQDNVKCGWLKYDKDKARYIIYPCADFKKIDIKITKYGYVANENAIDKFQRLGCKYPKIEGKTLVCTGFFKGKKHEYLFGEKTGQEIIINSDVANVFESINQSSPYLNDKIENNYRYRLDRNEEVPVFFIEGKNGDVSRFGFARMFRIAYEHSVSDGICQENRPGKDICQCIFGYTSKEKSLKGRVQFSHAFSKFTPDDNKLTCVNGVLCTPRASFYPFYLSQTGEKLKDYNSDNIEIAGRKRYPIHSDTYITKLPEGNNNNNIPNERYMLPANNIFTTEIAIHNLRKVEIGAILSALTFHNTPGTFHNIGMAKGYGYGKLKITAIELTGLSMKKEEYMKVFETEMNNFLGADWVKSEQVSRLIGMAKEHNAGLEMMKLKEYGNNKKIKNFNKLPESKAEVTSLITDDERINLRLSTELEKAKQYINENKFEEFFTISEKLKLLKLSEEQKKSVEALISEAETRKNKIAERIFNERINRAKRFLDDNDL